MEKKDLAGFAKRFNEAREEAGAPKTQASLGKMFAVSGNTAWNWMNGGQLPSMAHAISIGLKFGVCVEWLLTGRGPKHPPVAAGAHELVQKAMRLDEANQRVLQHFVESMLAVQLESERSPAESRPAHNEVFGHTSDRGR